MLSEGDYKKYRLRLLLCIAERTAGLSPECEECTAFKQDISALVNNVGNLVQIGEKESRKAHKKTMDRMISHLQKAHNIVTEGYYTGMWIGIGTALGLPFGIPLGNISFGIPIGLLSVQQ